MKAALSLIACFAIPCAALAGLAAYDRSETRERFTIGTTWSGDKAIFQYTDGRLFAGTEAKTLGLFAAGNPRLVGLGCAGTDSPLIGMEESDFPACRRIEAISNYKPRLAYAESSR